MARYYLSMVLLGFFFPSMAQEQYLLSTAGGFYQNSELNVSWSLGEPVTETFGAGNYTLTQGFQQSKLDPVGIPEPISPNIQGIVTFPNPTRGLVYVKINPEQQAKPGFPNRYVLYEMQGKLLEQDAFSMEPLIIDLNKYTGSVYFLRFYNLESNTQSTVIIQKIN